MQCPHLPRGPGWVDNVGPDHAENAKKFADNAVNLDSITKSLRDRARSAEAALNRSLFRVL